MKILTNLLTLVTPDYGISDIWHQYLPFKYILSSALKQYHIPLWTRLVGGGQPILAQGQMGAFNLLNLLLFGLWPFPLAVNSFYLLNLIIGFIGCYLLGRLLKFNRITALFFGLTFSWSGFLISHASHWDIFQAACLLPFTFYFLLKAACTKKIKFLFLLSFIISQQIFTGATQIVFINSIALISLVVFLWWKKRINKNFIPKILLSFLFSLGLSAIQLLPSIQYMRSSVRNSGLSYQDIVSFPYPPRHLITFWNPFYFGSPQNGTYPTIYEGAGIFWENTTYIGKIGLILGLLGIFLKSDKNRKLIKYFATILLLFSLLLSFGNDSPFYFIYTFFPFNLFRVPSRFLILSSFSLITLASLSLDKIIHKCNKRGIIIAGLLIIINFSDITLNFYHYHALDKFQTWLSPPQTALQLKNVNQFKIFSMPSSAWNKIFLTKGWDNKTNEYHYLLNNLDPNFNALFNLRDLREHNSIPLKRNNMLDRLSYFQIPSLAPGQTINLQTGIINILRLNGVKYIISSNPLNSEQLIDQPILISSQNSLPDYYIYPVFQPAPFIRMVYSTFKANNLIDFNRIVGESNFNPLKSVILEQDQGEFNQVDDNYHIDIIKNTDTVILLKVNTTSRGVLVIADNYYPEWRAKLDNQPVAVIPINLIQKGIILEPGQHQLKIYYQAKYFKIGLFISICSFLFLLIKIRGNKRLKFIA